jgi:hypothetical protein
MFAQKVFWGKGSHLLEKDRKTMKSGFLRGYQLQKKGFGLIYEKQSRNPDGGGAFMAPFDCCRTDPDFFPAERME